MSVILIFATIASLTITVFIFTFLFIVKYNANKMVKLQKEIIKRHNDNIYTEFEVENIKSICDKALFPYYFFYCPNNNTWSSLKSRLSEDEKIYDITVVKFIKKSLIPYNKRLSILFITNKARIIIYKLSFLNLYKAKAKYLLTINLNSVKNIDYTIKPEMTYFMKFGIPVSLTIKDNNKATYLFKNTTGATAEAIRDFCWLTGQADDPYNEKDLNAEQRQLAKLDNLLSKGRISEEKHKDLTKIAKLSIEKIRTKIMEERIHT
ncbi:MAG: hypothetical protein AB1782_10025 [Cyanobacteriota bacterium]